MANELQAYSTTGLTLYAVLLNATGQAWNGSAFEAVQAANWATYDIALTEAAGGIYLANMPAVAAGAYSYAVYEQAGASPAITDMLRGTGSLEWDGSAVLPLSTLATPASVWSYSSRTLTQAAASVISAVSGSTITIQRGDTLSAALSNIGSLVGYVTVDFTVKSDLDDEDDDAILRIRLNASGLNDGLLIVNSVTATSEADGSITITDEPTGDITISLAASVTDDLEEGSYTYDVQLITATAVTTRTSGICKVVRDVTRAVV